MDIKIFLLIIFPIFASSQSVFDASKIDLAPSDELCDAQLEYIDKSLDQGALWAKIMRDSWGSFPSGTFSGNYYDFGSFDQCIRLTHNSISHGNFHGQHCTVMFQHDIQTEDRRLRFSPSLSPHTVIGIGVCSPHTCSPKRVMEIANLTLIATRNVSVANFISPELFCSTSQRIIEFNAVQIFAIILFSSIFLLMILSTWYEISCNIQNSKKYEIFCVFSIYSNSKIIMTMKSFSSKEMIFLHGIRSLAITWIVLGHTFAFFVMLPTMNSNDFFIWIRNFSSMIFQGGFMSVDTFFLLSAMLLTLSVFNELDKTKKINIFILYAKRYLRITAPLAACVLLTVTFFEYFSDGPLWTLVTSTSLVDFCKRYWWTTLLYVGNYVNPGMLCFGHAWYLMVDMQLYFLSPLILYPMWKFQKRIWIWVVVIFIIASISVFYVFAVIMIFGFRVSQVHELAQVKSAMTYYVTHARLDSWTMGILTGFLIYKMKDRNLKLPKTLLITGWTLSMMLILTVIFSQYLLHQANFNDNPLIADASFEAFSRIAWCIGVSWIIIACQLGYGGIIKRFLSLSIWLPISKLSYGIYLTHVLIQLVYMASMRSPPYFSNFTVMYKFFGDFSMAFIFAFLLALMFEYPTLRILKFLMDKRKINLEQSGNT